MYTHTDCPSCPHQTYHIRCDQIVAHARRDEASAYLLISYFLSTQARTRSGDDTFWQENATAMEYRGRGQNMLMQRLQDPRQASSDANIQAVLLLIALVSDFGDRGETRIHINGLKNMITQRGGLSQFAHEPFLESQIREIKLSKSLHLPLECGPDCPNTPRFSAEEQEDLTF